MKNLVTACKNVSDWYMLGIQLGLSPSQLDNIHMTYPVHGVERLMAKMFDVWLTSPLDASWMKLITALRNIDQHSLAKEITIGTYI